VQNKLLILKEKVGGGAGNRTPDTADISRILSKKYLPIYLQELLRGKKDEGPVL